MNVEIEIVKGIPSEQIENFLDKTVYNVAVETREETKSLNAFPVRTGTLQREEVAQEIIGNNKEYGLGAGTSYAKYVWKMENVNWTNKSTLPHWYYTVFNKKGATILTNAINKALKGLK
jgi:hypothetical protein